MEGALSSRMSYAGGLEAWLSPEEQRRLTMIVARFAATVSQMQPQEAVAHIEERVGGLHRLYLERYGEDPIGLLDALQVVLRIRNLIYDTVEVSRSTARAAPNLRSEVRPALMTRPRVPARPSARARVR